MRLKSEQSNNDEQLNSTPTLGDVGVGHEVWRLKMYHRNSCVLSSGLSGKINH